MKKQEKEELSVVNNTEGGYLVGEERTPTYSRLDLEIDKGKVPKNGKNWIDIMLIVILSLIYGFSAFVNPDLLIINTAAYFYLLSQFN